MSGLSITSFFGHWLQRGPRLSAAEEALVQQRLAQAAKTFWPGARVLSSTAAPTRAGALGDDNPAVGTARVRMAGSTVDVQFTLTPNGGEVRVDPSLEKAQVATYNGTRFIARPQAGESEPQRQTLRRQIDEFVDNTARATPSGPVLEAKNVLSQPEIAALIASAQGPDGQLTPGGREELEQLLFRSAFSETAKDAYATESARAEASQRHAPRPHFQLTRRAMESLYGALGLGNPYKAYLDAHPEL